MSWQWCEDSGIDLEVTNKRAAETTARSQPDSEEEVDMESNGGSEGKEESQGASGLSEAE